MNYVVEEKKLIEKFPGVQDEAKVLNEMLKKSHLVVSYHRHILPVPLFPITRALRFGYKLIIDGDTNHNQANFTLSLTYNIEMTIIKLAFLCYFFPLLPALRLRLRITLYLTTLYLLFTCVAQLLSTLLYCHPISLNWAAPPTCALENSFPGVILQFGINLSTSLLLLLLVLFILAQRLVTRYDKLGVGIIVIIGMLAPTMALLRVIAIWPLVQDGHVHMAELTRANSSYGVIEALAVMVAFFCPALRVWFRERVGDGASASPTGLMARSGVDVSKTTKGSRGNSGSTLPRWQGGTGLWRSTRNGSWDSTDQGAETEGELAARDDMNMGRGVREYVWNGQGRPPTWI